MSQTSRIRAPSQSLTNLMDCPHRIGEGSYTQIQRGAQIEASGSVLLNLGSAPNRCGTPHDHLSALAPADSPQCAAAATE